MEMNVRREPVRATLTGECGIEVVGIECGALGRYSAKRVAVALLELASGLLAAVRQIVP
jgi:hypothetical protein